MVVYVLFPDGKSVKISAYATDTVENVTEKIAGVDLSFLANKSVLVFGDSILKDGRTLADYAIKEFSVIQLIIRLPQEIILFVRTKDESDIALSVKPTNTISTVKEMIQAKQDVPVDQQVLVHNGKTLENDHTLADYQIQQESIVHLLRYRKNMLRIFVKIHVSGHSVMAFQVKPTDKISSIKAMIQSKEGIPTVKQLLLHNDELLKDTWSVCGCNIHEDSTLDLIVKGAMQLLESEEVQDVRKKPGDLQRKIQKQMNDMAIRLKVDDIREVIIETADVLCSWEELGISLGVSSKQLERISSQYLSILRCHYQVLRHWIIELGGSWEGLVAALRHDLVNQKDLATKLETKYVQGSGNAVRIQATLVTENRLLKADDDLSDVFKRVDWRILGVLLGISDSTLEDIENGGSFVEQCQQLMIEHWINTGQAYWSILIDTLKCPVLGNERLANKFAKEYLNQDRDVYESLPDGTLPVDENEVSRIENKLDEILKGFPEKLGKQSKGIAFVLGMTASVTGVDADVENVRKVFQDELRFAVFALPNPTSSEIVALMEVAASYDYPVRSKHKCFYFAGHGGIDEHQRPFFKPLINSNNEVFLIHENILARFKKIGPQHQFVFFFDCCLSPKPSDNSSSSLPKLLCPPRCLVSYATHAGYKAYGDREQGGIFTSYLCDNIKRKMQLVEILANTHENVDEYFKMKDKPSQQLPEFHSCVGPIYFNGIPDRYVIQPSEADQESQNNILKRFHSDLLEAFQNETVLTQLAILLHVKGILSQETQNSIDCNKKSKVAASVLVAALEKKVDDCPEIFDIIIAEMKHIEKLRGLVMMMKGEEAVSEDTAETSDIMYKALESSQKREKELQEKVEQCEKKISEMEQKHVRGKITLAVENADDGKLYLLDVLASTSISSVKSLVEFHNGVPVKMQQLFFGDQRLIDSYCIGDYGIQNRDTVQLINYALQHIQVLIKLPSETELLPLDVELCDTVEMLKFKIKDKKGIPISMQRLKFGTVVLQNYLLRWYNIKDNCTLHLFINE